MPAGTRATASAACAAPRAACCRRRRRPRGPCATGGSCGRQRARALGDARRRRRSTGGLAPASDVFRQHARQPSRSRSIGCVDAPPGAELLDRLLERVGAVVVDDDECRRSRPGRTARRARRRSRRRRSPPIRSNAICSIGASASVSTRRSLQEADPFVEQAEAGEAVAHAVEIGEQIVEARRSAMPVDGRKRSATQTWRSSISCASRYAAHEDRRTAAPGAAFDEVAADGRRADVVEARFEMVESGPGPSSVYGK